MNVVFALCCLVVAPPPASDAAPSLTVPTLVYALAAVADNGTTYVNLSHGFRERNPFVRPFDHNPSAVLALGLAADVATVTLVHRLGKNRPTLAKWTLYGIAAVRLFFAVDNFRAFHQWRRR